MRSLVSLGVYTAVAAFASSAASGAATKDRPWTPEDSAAVRYFAYDMSCTSLWTRCKSDPVEWVKSNGPRENSFVVSPDGASFFVISSSSDLQEDVRTACLSIYS